MKLGSRCSVPLRKQRGQSIAKLAGWKMTVCAFFNRPGIKQALPKVKVRLRLEEPGCIKFHSYTSLVSSSFCDVGQAQRDQCLAALPERTFEAVAKIRYFRVGQNASRWSLVIWWSFSHSLSHSQETLKST